MRCSGPLDTTRRAPPWATPGTFGPTQESRAAPTGHPREANHRVESPIVPGKGFACFRADYYPRSCNSDCSNLWTYGAVAECPAGYTSTCQADGYRMCQLSSPTSVRRCATCNH